MKFLMYKTPRSYCINEPVDLLYDKHSSYCMDFIVATVPKTPIYNTSYYKTERIGNRRNEELERKLKKNMNEKMELSFQHYFSSSPFHFVQPEGEVSPSPLCIIQMPWNYWSMVPVQWEGRMCVIPCYTFHKFHLSALYQPGFKRTLHSSHFQDEGLDPYQNPRNRGFRQ